MKDNKIIIGDFLKCSEDIEKGTVQTIYFDPPFRTQRDYRLTPKDDLGFDDTWDSEQDYEYFIDKMLEKSVPLLTKTGTFFFHISATEMLIPHSLLKKHFKYIQPIFWKRSRSKNNIKKKPGATVDVIFRAFNNPTPLFNMVYQPLDQYYLEHSYTNKDDVGYYALGHLTTDKTRKAKEGRNYEIEVDGRVFKAENGWRLSKEDLEDLIKEGRVHIPKKEGAKLYRKLYRHENPGKPVTDLWDDIHSLGQGGEKREYPTQKPIKLLERIIEMSSNEGDLILDPSSGAGTTGVAAQNLNRKYVLVDINPDTKKIVQKRLDNL